MVPFVEHFDNIYLFFITEIKIPLEFLMCLRLKLESSNKNRQ